MWSIFQRILFLCDPERTHRLAIHLLRLWSHVVPAQTPLLQKTCFGLTFPNPIGLAAGFDKDAEALSAWEALGFGFVEVGTVTALPQAGNPKPRLFRMPRERALRNCMGFNNSGAQQVAERIARVRARKRISIPVGVNIGKSKTVSLDEAPRDYLTSFGLVADVADYIVINVSSPNTPGLRDLQRRDHLHRLLDVLCAENAKRARPRPLLLKLSPDLSDDDALACAESAVRFGLSGLVISNTTQAPQGGGISGAPLFGRSTALLRHLHHHFSGTLSFIGVGGIMNADDAKKKFAAGADLIQAYTGFVYGGPAFCRQIIRQLRDEYPFPSPYK